MNGTAALLLAEPEDHTRTYLQRHLGDDGFQVLGAAACTDALELAERARPDLVVAGEIELCRRLREGEPGRSWNRDVPVILIGGSDADAVDRVRAFERGCDDYLDRPFHYDELLARIRAVLRRVQPGNGDRVHVGDISIDRPTRCVRVAGKRLDLPAKEYELLAKLAEAPTRVFTKDELLRDVWGFRAQGSSKRQHPFRAQGRTRTLDSHASRLRRKIAEHTDAHYVVNVWGVGYRLQLPD